MLKHADNTATQHTSKDDFLDELNKLTKRFQSMDAELELTVRDSSMGVEGFVVVWNTGICKGGPFDNEGRGCGKGGTRIKTGLSLEDVRRLARTMAEKNAAAGLPLGGAKSGLNADPDAPDYEQKYRRFVRLVHDAGILNEHGGVFGGFGYDIGGRPPFNAQWACDEIGSTRSFTGKPVDMGGTDYDRQGIAGLGVAAAGRKIVDLSGRNISETTFAVQGCGAMGAAVIHYFNEFGGNLTYLSDPKYGGTWHFKDGASDDLVNALFTQDLTKATALFRNEGEAVSSDSLDVLYQDVDVLFPCALEDTITDKNAAKIKAPLIIEGANNPTTDDAHDILYTGGKFVVPDILANPGGIIAAYVELTSKVTDEANIMTQAKVQEAKETTINRIEKNIEELHNLVSALDVRPDMVADYMTYKNIFKE